MTGYPFQGVIPVTNDGENEKPLSAFLKTEWINDVVTIKGETVSAFKQTEWDNDAPANPEVLGIKLLTSEW